MITRFIVLLLPLLNSSCWSRAAENRGDELTRLLAEAGGHGTSAHEAAYEAFRRLAGSSDAADRARARDLVTKAAEGGHAAAQNSLALTLQKARWGGEPDPGGAALWFRKAAAQGHPVAMNHLGLALAQGTAAPAGASGGAAEAAQWFERAAELGHQGAMYNLGLSHAQGAATHKARADSDLGKGADLAAAAAWFTRAAEADPDTAVAANARAALAQVTSALASSKADAGGAEVDTAAEAEAERARLLPLDARGLEMWDAGVAAYGDFIQRFEANQILDDACAALLRRSAGSFTELAIHLQTIRAETNGKSLWNAERADAVLGQLQQAYAALSRVASPSELAAAGEVSAARADLPSCRAKYAADEREGSCFNTCVSASVTLLRRAGELEAARQVATVLAHDHPEAATKYRSSLQTPHVFFPHLTSKPWWDKRDFPVALKLEASHANIRAEVRAALGNANAAAAAAAVPNHRQPKKLGGGSSGGGGGSSGGAMQRVFNPAAPISPGSLEADRRSGGGAWAELPLFDGAEWDEGHCSLVPTVCSILRDSPEVCGTFGRAYEVCGTRVVATIFRLQPGSRVLPHTGTTNRRLVLQFAVTGSEGVRFRVGEEWRSYAQGGGSDDGGSGGGGGDGDGHAIIFDDSFEHEVEHGGEADRFVIYAALYHPELELEAPAVSHATGEPGTCPESKTNGECQAEDKAEAGAETDEGSTAERANMRGPLAGLRKLMSH